MNAIELVGIRKAFNRGRPTEVWALDGIDVTIPAGQVAVFSGPSGSGKTTLLSIIGGMARPTEGRVRLDGQDVSSYSERFLTVLRRMRFGFVFQDLHLIRGLSALENVMIPAYPLGNDWHPLRDRALSLLSRLDVVHRAATRVEFLSGGEQQRVAIARALVRPPVLLADEPTANPTPADDAVPRHPRVTQRRWTHDPDEQSRPCRHGFGRHPAPDRHARRPDRRGPLMLPATRAGDAEAGPRGAIALAVIPFAVSIVRYWDLGDASERQLRLERRTRLVSTLVAFAMGLQILTLPVLVFTADRLAAQLSGAMCAVGTLNANAYGFPALSAQMVAFFAAVAWLALDAMDVSVPSYPLTRVKYVAALVLAPLLALAAGLPVAFFGCSSHRSSPRAAPACTDAPSVSGALAAWPGPAMIAFTSARRGRHVLAPRGDGRCGRASAALAGGGASSPSRR
jgi:putative ABC transport system ATP-binding protein